MGMMKRGIVVEGRGSQVRVRFDEHDGVISPWLDVAQESTIGKRSYRRFRPGEMVRCWLDDKAETGEALYAIYNDKNPTPADSDELYYEEALDGAILEWGVGFWRHSFPDGTFMEYLDGNIRMHAAGDINLIADGNVRINGQRIDFN